MKFIFFVFAFIIGSTLSNPILKGQNITLEYSSGSILHPFLGEVKFIYTEKAAKMEKIFKPNQSLQMKLWFSFSNFLGKPKSLTKSPLALTFTNFKATGLFWHSQKIWTLIVKDTLWNILTFTDRCLHWQSFRKSETSNCR